MVKSALITGCNGQDGSYLAELLISKGYKVYGTVRRNSISENQSARINHLLLETFYVDMTDSFSVSNIISKIKPDELYHLAAQSHVQVSFEIPLYTLNTNAGGTLNILEAVKNFSPHTKVYFAATSEMFGNQIDADGFQRETTPMIPVSPYGCSKLYGYNLCHNYRNAYGLYVTSGILNNHESPRRSITFVTNKICKAAVEIHRGKREQLELGNLEAARDWSHAQDMVQGMWLSLQQDAPMDFVLASGESRTVREFCRQAFELLELDYTKYVVSQTEKYMRPEELSYLKGDSTKFRTLTDWTPKYTFDTMLKEMIEYWKDNE